MAKAKNYQNYAEIVGNVANIYAVSEKTGEMRFSLANHRSFTKKDGSKGEDTQFINVLVRPGRKWASQDSVQKGKFLRVIGHLENNSYKTQDGSYKGGIEINADKIVVLEKKADGSVDEAEPTDADSEA